MTTPSNTTPKTRAPKANSSRGSRARSGSGAASAPPPTGATIRVTRLRSAIRRPSDQEATMRALGLFRRHQVRVLADTPATRGRLRKIAHLVEIEGEISR